MRILQISVPFCLLNVKFLKLEGKLLGGEKMLFIYKMAGIFICFPAPSYPYWKGLKDFVCLSSSNNKRRPSLYRQLTEANVKVIIEKKNIAVGSTCDTMIRIWCSTLVFDLLLTLVGIKGHVQIWAIRREKRRKNG